MLDKLKKLSEKRINYFIEKSDSMSWYKGSKTYFEAIKKEIEETEKEVNTNKVLLEDELGDILWDFLCLVESLKQEGKIDGLDKVIQRAYTKYSGRINIETGAYNGKWEEIKKQQKEKLEQDIRNLNK